MKTNFRFLIILAVLGLFVACNSAPKSKSVSTIANTKSGLAIKNGMTKVTVLYPNGVGKSFDMDYYVNHHMKMVKNLGGDSIKAITIDKGIAGGAPDAPVPYLAIGNMYFDNISAFQNSLGPHNDKLIADIANFTNCDPIFLINIVEFAE